MHVEIRFTRRAYESLRTHLLQPDGLERAAYLFAGPNSGPGRLILNVREVWPVPPEALAHQTHAALEVKADYIRTVLQHVAQTGADLGETHSHSFSVEGVRFSHIDTSDESKKFPYVAARIPNIHHFTMVLGQASVDAHLYDRERAQVVPIAQVVVLDTPIRRIVPSTARDRSVWERTDNHSSKIASAGRFSRQVLAFGEAGQIALSELTVGIAGAGSLGMLLAQELALLGICSFVIADMDRVEVTNLNRLVGATPIDAERHTPKVEVAARMIHAIAPEAKVAALPVSVLGQEAHQALKKVDVLFGATDNFGSRLVLNDRYALQYLIPYIDAGTGLEVGSSGKLTAAGGWVRTVIPGEWCLNCIGAINREQAGLELLSPSERERAMKRGYIANAEVPAPSVIFLNSAVASLAVAEFVNLVTGFKPPHPLIQYDLLRQSTRAVKAQRREDCPSCSSQGLLGWGDLEPFPNYEGDEIEAPSANGPQPETGRISGSAAPMASSILEANPAGSSGDPNEGVHNET